MALTIELENIQQLITERKQHLRQQNPNYAHTFAQLSQHIEQEVAEIATLRNQGESPVPQIDFSAIQQGLISDETRELIRKRGCVVIRNTVARELAEDWNKRIGQYITDSGYYDDPDKGLDKYFSSLQSGKPQIFSVYWSKPQMEARQHENLAATRRFLNRLWHYKHEGQAVFDPDRECTYADRTRRREPGDDSLGLKPHIDGGSIERWLDTQGYQQVFRHLIKGNWQDYDPYEAAHRVHTQEIPSPAVCSMFRTFQGWTALTPQGPNDGTLQLIPSAKVMAWMFLRALQDDVPTDNLCDAEASRALRCSPEWHQTVLSGLCSIPMMQPGDTIWWHPDVVHGVEDEHQGTSYSNVIYIGAAPYCDKNAAFLPKQAIAFNKGESSPDFAPEHYEINVDERASRNDLSELGQRQMGLLDW